MSFRPLTRLVLRDVAVWEALGCWVSARRRLCRQPSSRRVNRFSQSSSGGERDRQGESFGIRVEDYDGTIGLAQLFGCQVSAALVGLQLV